MTDELEQAMVEAQNRREAWREVATTLDRAKDAVEWAQGLLASEPIASEDLADQLQPIYENLRAAATDALSRAEGDEG